MRVVGGGLKGRRLKGVAAPGVRPTSELVRGAIFNILGPLASSTRAMDLFAGSGSLGIEALSRGVEWVDFVERHPKQCEVLKENLETVRMTDSAKVHCVDVAKALQSLDGPLLSGTDGPALQTPDGGRGPRRAGRLGPAGGTMQSWWWDIRRG